MDQNKDPERWRALAEQASKETDPKKLLELTRRINEILEENDAAARKKPPTSASAA